MQTRQPNLEGTGAIHLRNSMELERERLRFEDERQRVQAALEQQRLALDLERAKLEAQYKRQVLEGDLDRQKLQVDELSTLLGQGDFARLGLQLAQDPQAIDGINAYLAGERSADAERQLRALKLLVENDGLEGWRITDQAKTVLQRLIDSWSQSAGLPGASTQDALAAPPEDRVVDVRDEVVDVRVAEGGAAGTDEYPGDRATAAPA